MDENTFYISIAEVRSNSGIITDVKVQYLDSEHICNLISKGKLQKYPIASTSTKVKKIIYRPK